MMFYVFSVSTQAQQEDLPVISGIADYFAAEPDRVLFEANATGKNGIDNVEVEIDGEKHIMEKKKSYKQIFFSGFESGTK
jgi:hypothetical protein